MNTNLNNENLDQKIDRLKKTIDRCIFQMNDTRNTKEIIETFTRAKAEAERQLDAAIKEKAAVSSNTPKPAQNSATDRNTGTNSKNGTAAGVGGPRFSINHTKPRQVQSPDQTQTHVITAAPTHTLLVKIEWPGGEKEPVVLGPGEALSRFTVTLRDCADSQTAAQQNWDKLQMSKQFNTLCLYFRAYALFPRPSQEPLPTMKDIGEQYFKTAVRKKIFELILETINQDNNE